MFATRENLYYVGSVPEAKYWTSGKIPEQYKNVNTFDFKEVCLHYQTLDCVSLYLIWKKYYKVLHDITGLSIYYFISAPSLSYEYVFSNSPVAVEYVKNKGINKFIRTSYQGGRTFCQKPTFKSKQYDLLQGFEQMNQEERKNVYDQITDYLTDFDAVGLYSSVMYLFDYPVGVPVWVEYLEGLRERLMNRSYDKH